MIAAMGRQLKQSVNVFHSLMLYLRLPVPIRQTMSQQTSMGVLPTLIIEAVYPIDAGAFVVATKNEKVFWVLDLVSEEQTDRLQ